MTDTTTIQAGQRVEVTLIRGGGYLRDSSIYEGGREVTKVGTVTEVSAGKFGYAAVEFDDGDFQLVNLPAFGPDYEGGFPVRAARTL